MAKIKSSYANLVGVTCAVPKQVLENKYFESSFKQDEIENVTRMTGVHSRRNADEETCTSDLCYAAAENILLEIGWEKESVDALIFISQTPDYILPATSCILQDRLKLSTNCAAFDINLGCSAYVYGLWMASNLISSGNFRRVLLMVGDTCSKFVSREDRSTALLFGDAGSTTALEYSPNAEDSFFILGTDGSGKNNLIITTGGYRNGTNLENTRGNELFMDGEEIFKFTLKRVIPLLKEVLNFSDRKQDDIDYFVFHQANEFILNYLSKKMKLPKIKTPLSIEQYGNTSSASIPLTLVTKCQDSLLTNSLTLAFAGFGVGYSWGGAVIQTDILKCANLIEI